MAGSVPGEGEASVSRGGHMAAGGWRKLREVKLTPYQKAQCPGQHKYLKEENGIKKERKNLSFPECEEWEPP